MILALPNSSPELILEDLHPPEPDLRRPAWPLGLLVPIAWMGHSVAGNRSLLVGFTVNPGFLRSLLLLL